MRLVRLGDASARVGADLRAALASWGQGDEVLGGVALLGVRPPGCPHPLEAVLVLPRGLVVVVGVDLPDPSVRLDAPLTGRWRTDGWPLVGPGAGANPATPALAAAGEVTARLQAHRVEPLPVGVVVAVGPYAAQVSQPTADLVRGVRVLHPEPMTLLNAVRELATHTRDCPVVEARRVIEALHPPGVDLDPAVLVAEGFPDLATGGAAETTIIPRVASPSPRPRALARVRAPHQGPRWLPIAAVALVVALLFTGIVLALTAGDPKSEPVPAPERAPTTPVDGVAFTPKGSTEDTDCAAHTHGDLRTRLASSDCTRLIRARYEVATGDGRAAVLVAVLRFSRSTSAAELRALAERPGAGGVADQSAEGVPWPGGDTPRFASAARVGGQEGNSVKLVQVAWLDRPSEPTDPQLRAVADRALRLTLAG